MADQMPNEDIVRKIQLLLNLGSRAAGNEQEASAAMAKAQELLAKYNLALADVQAKVVKGGTTQAAPEKREKTVIKKSAMYTWQQQLCNAIAKCNFCVYWIWNTSEEYNKRYSWGMEKAHRRVKRHMVLGRESNTVAVRIMYEYIVETIERILPYPNVERLSKSAVSWREGCAYRLIERIQEKYDAMRRDQTPVETHGTSVPQAIVLQSLDKSEEAANYDAEHGEGAWARKLASDAEWNAQWAEKSRLRDEKRKQLLANESPEDRLVREANERAEEEKARKQFNKWADQEERKRQRYWANKDISAYRQGQRVGDSISLNDQLDTTDQEKLR